MRFIGKYIGAAIVIFALPAVRAGQHSSPHASVAPVVDGSQHPELISDREAIAMLFAVIDLPPSPLPEQVAAVKVRIQRMNLDPSDTAILLAEAQAFHAEVEPLKAKIRATDDAKAAKRVVDFAARRDAGVGIADAAYRHFGRLTGSLSVPGKNRLNEHLAYIKTRMKIIPPPKM